MRVGIFRPSWLDLSVETYLDNVARELQLLGVELRFFATSDPLPPDCHVYWDPRLTGGTPPWHRLTDTNRPVVVTAHGASPLTVPPWEYYGSVRDSAKGLWGVGKRLWYWRRWRWRCAAIITSSDDARKEIERRFWLRGENIVRIYHGVDHEIFKPCREQESRKEPYLLHVSAFQPVKNVRRILEAFQRLRRSEPSISLIAVVPHYDGEHVRGAGVRWITESLTHEELAQLYRGALGFVFPSLTESFGMPILEAMACGCPVITSGTSACTEIAGQAALTVNPRSAAEIAEAMGLLVASQDIRTDLRAAGLERAGGFSWRQCANEHLAVFEQAAGRSGSEPPRSRSR